MREGFKKVRLYILGAISLLVSLWILWASHYPYAVEQFFPDRFLAFIFIIYLALPAVTILSFFVAALFFSKSFREDCLLLLKKSCFLLLYLIPPVIAFSIIGAEVPLRLVYSQFSESLDATLSMDPDKISEKRFGPWKVIEARKDERGGLYLMTDTRSDLIDGFYFGFAYQPNQEGSPFGNAYYEIKPLGDGWYTFTANSDW